MKTGALGLLCRSRLLHRQTGRIVEVDVERYQAILDQDDLSAEQKQAILEALWSIILAFVDLGFGVNPLQEVCGQSSVNGSESLHQVESSVLSKPTAISEEFKKAVLDALESTERRNP